MTTKLQFVFSNYYNINKAGILICPGVNTDSIYNFIINTPSIWNYFPIKSKHTFVNKDTLLGQPIRVNIE